jgi:hypothetical protein
MVSSTLGGSSPPAIAGRGIGGLYPTHNNKKETKKNSKKFQKKIKFLKFSNYFT